MAVTTEQISALHTYLALAPEAIERSQQTTLTAGRTHGFSVLLYSALMTATRCCFRSGWTWADITCQDQFRVVHRWHARAQRDTRAITAIIWGTRPHTAIEQAVAGRVSDDSWPDQLADALDSFTKVSWTRNLLSLSTASRDNGGTHD
jgi:hypothetical protein